MMALPTKKTDLTFRHSAQADDLRASEGSAAGVKAVMDSQGLELLGYVNAILDALKAVVADGSGAHQVGSAPITGVDGATVYAQLTALKTAIDGVAMGEVPDGSVTGAKLSPEATLTLQTITDSVTDKKVVWELRDGKLGFLEVE
jgi:hypothetical protein